MAIKAAGLRLQLCAAATNTDTMNSRGRKINDLQKWRRGWDLNPRYGFPYARFRGECFQPLSHLSADREARLAEELPEPQCCAGSGCSAIQNSRRGRHSTACGEKLLQKRGTLLLQNPRGDLHPVVQLRMGQHFKARAHRAAFRIVRAIDDPRHTRLYNGAGAHGARFKRYVQGRAAQPVISFASCSLAQGHDFRMRSRIAIANRAVSPVPKNFSLAH